ncbi:Putative ribonuclease H protein At1g65750 [Linum perenne]
MSWEKICTPKALGGFGLKQARFLNLAYMVKLAFVCSQQPDLLWVKVLQGKYLRESTMGFSLAHRTSQSNTWKGICKAWPFMMLGSRAGVRNGKETLFWTSRWLDSGVLLRDWAIESDPDFNALDTVSDFSSDELGWNMEKLNKLLPQDFVEQVVGRAPPRSDLGDDNWIWGEDDDGRFSVGSAYNLVTDQGSLRSEFNWEKVWRWKGPHRIKLFLWLGVNNRLITNAEKARRHLSTSTSCNRCGCPVETVSHVLRDCPIAVETWNRLGFQVDVAAGIADWRIGFAEACGVRTE